MINKTFPALPLNDTTSFTVPAVDERGLVEFLQALIKIPSVTGSKEESKAQHWLAGRLKENHFDTDLWPVDLPAILKDPLFPGMEVARDEAWGLVGSWGGSSGPTLTLNGHIDVVPEGDLEQWQDKEAFSGRILDGKVYGRGACDMKAGLVCNLFAVKAIQEAGLKLRGKVLLQSVVSEEDGGLGTFATIRRGYRGDAAIISEPTEMQIIPACAGALTFRLRLSGLSAHASTRKEGVSAIEKFWKIWQALEELEKRRNSPGHTLMKRFDLPYPLSIGILQAGNWPSSVPDQLMAEGRLGVALGEDPGAARQELEKTLDEVCQQDQWLSRHPVRVEWYGGQFASGQIPGDHPLVNLVSNTHLVLNGKKPEVHGAPYGSDLRLMTGIGLVPTLHYGPGSVKNAHAPNEFVPISELIQATRALAAVIIQFCGLDSGVE